MLKKENANPSSLARKEDTVADHSFLPNMPTRAKWWRWFWIT